MRITHLLALAAGISVFAMSPAQAQDYGTSINFAQAKEVLAAAEAEAAKQKFTVAIAIVDTSGKLVAFSKGDNTQIASVEVSEAKAVSAVGYKRPTKAFQDTVAGGGVGLRVLTLPGAVAAEGGVPLLLNGAIIGAIGVSGMSSEQDGIVAAAGVAAIE
ncbi:MAG: heme-binding protein [Pseudomonadota bacterium]